MLRGAYRLLYLELTLGLVRLANVSFPIWDSLFRFDGNVCSLQSGWETIAYCFGCVQSVLRSCFRFFGCDDIVFPKMATVGIGIVGQSMAFVSCLPLNLPSKFGRRRSKFSAGVTFADAVIWLAQWGYKLFLIQTRWLVVPHCLVLCALPWTLVRGIFIGPSLSSLSHLDAAVFVGSRPWSAPQVPGRTCEFCQLIVTPEVPCQTRVGQIITWHYVTWPEGVTGHTV